MFDDTDGLFFRGDNDFNGLVTFASDVSVEGDLYTYSNVEFHVDDHEDITFKGNGEVYFNDDLHVVSQDNVEWQFKDHGDVEFLNNQVIVDTSKNLNVKPNADFRKDVTVYDDLFVGDDLKVAGDTLVEGTITVLGVNVLGSNIVSKLHCNVVAVIGAFNFVAVGCIAFDLLSVFTGY